MPLRIRPKRFIDKWRDWVTTIYCAYQSFGLEEMKIKIKTKTLCLIKESVVVAYIYIYINIYIYLPDQYCQQEGWHGWECVWPQRKEGEHQTFC